MPLAAGSQSTKVRIEKATNTRDPDSNEEIQTWGKFREVWLSFDPRTGGEYFEGGSRYSQTVVNMTGDYLDLRGVTAGMRLYAPDPSAPDDAAMATIWDIKTVLPDNDRRGRTKLQCVAGEGAR
jgi:head-tail adaptor